MDISKLLKTATLFYKYAQQSNIYLDVRNIINECIQDLERCINAKGTGAKPYWSDAMRNFANPWPLPENMGLNNEFTKSLIEILDQLKVCVQLCTNANNGDSSASKTLHDNLVWCLNSITEYPYALDMNFRKSISHPIVISLQKLN